MIKAVAISLENEMDLVLAHRKSMKFAERLGLTIATQTTFATAVSEIARTVIEHTDGGFLDIGLEQKKTRYALVAMVTYDSTVHFTNADEGFYFAQKLVPEFDLNETSESNQITMKIGLPRSLRIDPVKIATLKNLFAEEGPINAYEEIKRRNISLHKLSAEQEEEIRQTKLINAQKTEFISIASHEIKTPVTILKAYTQMAKASKEPVSERLMGMLDKIDLQATKLTMLVQQLLDIAKIENGNILYTMEETPLNDFISSQVAVMAHVLPSHSIKVALDENVTVPIDKLRMEQVFNNLIGNAAKYSGNGTEIVVKTKLEADCVLISVNDKGLGMSPETIESVFNKFYRSKDVLKSHSGLGMGLYITSKIIADHGGKIWVESKLTEGSTFKFTLPNHTI